MPHQQSIRKVVSEISITNGNRHTFPLSIAFLSAASLPVDPRIFYCLGRLRRAPLKSFSERLCMLRRNPDVTQYGLSALIVTVKVYNSRIE
jgi:hypothetical protein